jgi:aryl-alcohol dehydrogenase-like predicted oxidoreductase
MNLHPLAGTDLQLSTFCCGLGDLFSLPPKESDALLDTYVEAGGNFFDTAHMYSHWLPGGNGLSEISIGDYLRRRGIKNAVVATKGGAGSLWRYRTTGDSFAPGRISADIDDSLARLEVETIELYYFHGDDPARTPEELIDILHAEIRRGRIRHIAVSNWPGERIAAANAYAHAKKLPPFVISSPRWSLAAHAKRPGLNAATEAAWYRASKFPVAPYCPTAWGFFAGVPYKGEDPYKSSENHRRRDRARELAKKRGVAPNEIALAWMLRHPFPVFPILGTKNPVRLKEAMTAEDIHLTPEEVKWLESGNAV